MSGAPPEDVAPHPRPGRDVAPAAAILAARARALAVPTRTAALAESALEVLTFTVTRERYALETAWVHAVVRLTQVTPVPGAPDLLVGVTAVRGELLPVMDLRRLLGLPAAGLSDLGWLVVLGADGPDVGLLADRVHEVTRVPHSALHRAIEGGPSAGADCRLGVTPDALSVLDGRALLALPQLTIDGGTP